MDNGQQEWLKYLSRMKQRSIKLLKVLLKNAGCQFRAVLGVRAGVDLNKLKFGKLRAPEVHGLNMIEPYKLPFFCNPSVKIHCHRPLK